MEDARSDDARRHADLSRGARCRRGLQGRHRRVRQRAGLRIQREHGQGRGQRVVAVAAHRVEQALDRDRRHLPGQRGEMLLQQVQRQRLVDARVVIIGIVEHRRARRIHARQPTDRQHLRRLVLLQARVAGRQQHAGCVVAPSLGHVAIELLLHCTQQVADIAALAHQQVNGEGALAQRREVVPGAIRGQRCQVAVERVEQVGRHRDTAVARLQQVERGVTGHEGVGIGRCRPQAEAALAVLPRAQHIHQPRRIDLALDRRSEFGPRCIHQRGNRLADQLFGAQVRIVAQVGRQSVDCHQRRHGSCDTPRGQRLVHGAQLFQHDALTGATRAQLLARRHRRP